MLISAENGWPRRLDCPRVLRSPMPFVELKDRMGVPLRLPITPASVSPSSSTVVRVSATLGGRVAIRCDAGLRLPRPLPLEPTVELFEMLRVPVAEGARMPTWAVVLSDREKVGFESGGTCERSG